MTHLILVRHGESLWNKAGLWTGWTDIGLSEKGIDEAIQAGHSIKDIPIDEVYLSKLTRAKQTWEEIAKIIRKESLPTHESEALNERDYGDYTGKNKWDLKNEFGSEKFYRIRRGFDEPIPNGETLKDVYNRTVPYFQNEILPKLKDGKNILISAHGNSLRALVKYLDKISDEDVSHLEIKTGEVYVYAFDKNGEITDKKVLSEHLQ